MSDDMSIDRLKNLFIQLDAAFVEQEKGEDKTAEIKKLIDQILDERKADEKAFERAFLKLVSSEDQIGSKKLDDFLNKIIENGNQALEEGIEMLQLFTELLVTSGDGSGEPNGAAKNGWFAGNKALVFQETLDKVWQSLAKFEQFKYESWINKIPEIIESGKRIAKLIIEGGQKEWTKCLAQGIVQGLQGLVAVGSLVKTAIAAKTARDAFKQKENQLAQDAGHANAQAAVGSNPVQNASPQQQKAQSDLNMLRADKFGDIEKTMRGVFPEWEPFAQALEKFGGMTEKLLEGHYNREKAYIEAERELESTQKELKRRELEQDTKTQEQLAQQMKETLETIARTNEKIMEGYRSR